MKRDKKTGRILKTHGYYGTRIYRIWQGMKNRATNKKDKDASRYINRGINMDPRWQFFENFLADMGEPPTKIHSIERIDNMQGYWPANCGWATPQEQAYNRRDNKMVSFAGKRKCLSAWAKDLDITKEALYFRLKSGWPLEKALTLQKGGIK